MTVPRLPFHDPPVPQNPVTASSAWIVLVVQVTGNGPMMTTAWEGLVVARLEAAAVAAAAVVVVVVAVAAVAGVVAAARVVETQVGLPAAVVGVV